MIKKIKFEFNDESEIEMINTDDGWVTKDEIERSIRNAKMALEKAFTPHLKSMLADKLKEDENNDG